MKQKCCVMGMAVLILLCVMCSGQRAADMEEKIGHILRLMVRGLDNYIPVYTEAAGGGMQEYTHASAGGEGQEYTYASAGGEGQEYTYASAGGEGQEYTYASAGGGTQEYTHASTDGESAVYTDAAAAGASGRELREEQALRGRALAVPEILQMPELPTGCEVTALAMALAYDGIALDKTVIAEQYLVYNREDDNMALGYVGDPFSEEGAGCFAPALQKTAEKIFEENRIDAEARDISGTDLRDLLVYLDAGRPVIVWTTMYMAEPEFTDVSARYQGRTYRWYRQEHCVVLSGYDPDARTVQVNDPLEGIVQRNMDAFRDIYGQTGQNALVLYIKS